MIIFAFNIAMTLKKKRTMFLASYSFNGEKKIFFMESPFSIIVIKNHDWSTKIL